MSLSITLQSNLPFAPALFPFSVILNGKADSLRPRCDLYRVFHFVFFVAFCELISSKDSKQKIIRLRRSSGAAGQENEDMILTAFSVAVAVGCNIF